MVGSSKAAAWQKTKDIFSRKQKEEPDAFRHVQDVADQQQVSSEVEIVQPKQPERAKTNMVEIERQASGDIFERLTGRATVSREEQPSIFDPLDETLDPTKEIDEPEIDH